MDYTSRRRAESRMNPESLGNGDVVNGSKHVSGLRENGDGLRPVIFPKDVYRGRDIKAHLSVGGPRTPTVPTVLDGGGCARIDGGGGGVAAPPAAG